MKSNKGIKVDGLKKKNYCSAEMESEIQMVESVEFAPVTLEHLGCIPMLRVGTRNSLFYLKLFLIMIMFGKTSLFESETQQV